MDACLTYCMACLLTRLLASYFSRYTQHSVVPLNLLGDKGHFHTKTILLDLSLYTKSFSKWPSCSSVSITTILQYYMSQAVHWKALRVLLQVTSVLVMGLAAWMDNHKLFSLSFWQYCLCLALSLKAWALHYPGWTHDLAARSLKGAQSLYHVPHAALFQTNIIVHL